MDIKNFITKKEYDILSRIPVFNYKSTFRLL